MTDRNENAPRRWKCEPITDERLGTLFQYLALNWGKSRKEQRRQLLFIADCLRRYGTVPAE